MAEQTSISRRSQATGTFGGDGLLVGQVSPPDTFGVDNDAPVGPNGTSRASSNASWPDSPEECRC